MGNRTKGFSVDWGGHHAAAQLIAEAGRLEGQGIAALAAGIASGVGAFAANRKQRRAEVEAKAEKAEDRTWQRDLAEARLTGYLPQRTSAAAAPGQPTAKT